MITFKILQTLETQLDVIDLTRATRKMWQVWGDERGVVPFTFVRVFYGTESQREYKLSSETDESQLRVRARPAAMNR